MDVLEGLGLSGKIDLYQVRAPYPLGTPFVNEICPTYENVLVLEETYPVIEMQLSDRMIAGRRSGVVPAEGELTPDVIRSVLVKFLGLAPVVPVPVSTQPGTRPTLCAGCGHRAAFYAIRETFPQGIFPSDIGCYTLGVNLGAVDTCHCMGAGISQATGFYHAYAQDGTDFPTIVATIGDSTFFHSGIPALLNAVAQGARFILVILDNATTAMTGHQPTPAQGRTASGGSSQPILIREVVHGSGVRFLRELDPYDMEAFTAALKEADRHCRSAEGGVAVIIASHPCVLQERGGLDEAARTLCVTEDCTACRLCLDDLECPAIGWDDEADTARIDRIACTGCGVCAYVCPVQAIVAEPGGRT